MGASRLCQSLQKTEGKRRELPPERPQLLSECQRRKSPGLPMGKHERREFRCEHLGYRNLAIELVHWNFAGPASFQAGPRELRPGVPRIGDSLQCPGYQFGWDYSRSGGGNRSPVLSLESIQPHAEGGSIRAENNRLWRAHHALGEPARRKHAARARNHHGLCQIPAVPRGGWIA